eukprot:3102823-Prymnesium_polylepis.1
MTSSPDGGTSKRKEVVEIDLTEDEPPRKRPTPSKAGRSTGEQQPQLVPGQYFVRKLLSKNIDDVVAAAASGSEGELDNLVVFAAALEAAARRKLHQTKTPDTLAE